MNSMKARLGSILVCAALLLPGVAQSQQPGENICDAVLAVDVFNVGQEYSTMLFARQMRFAFCNTEWNSVEDIRARSTSIGINYTELLRSLGFAGSDMENEATRREAYKQFCLRSDDQMLFSTSYSSSWRSSDTAVNAWKDCVSSFFGGGQEGTKAAIFPNEALTGAIIQISRRTSADPIKFLVNSVESSSGVRCTFNGSNVVGADFGAKTDVTFLCEKPRDIDASFSLSTTWGTIGVFRIPGFNPTIASLRAEIDQIRQQLLPLSTSISRLDARTSVELYDCEYPKTDIPQQAGYCKTPPCWRIDMWNAHDAEMDRTCPANKVMFGAYSIHHNDTEDRVFKFQCCSMRLQTGN
jgi:hypothetical protein